MPDNNERGFWKTVFLGPQPVEQRAASPLVLPPARSNAIDLNTDSALSIATVFRSVSLITTSVSQLSLSTYRGKEEIPNPLVITQPDNDRSLSSFLKRTTTGLATGGNAYWKLTRNSAGVVNNIEVLNPLAVDVRYSDTGVKSYGYGSKTFSDKNVKHLRLMEVPGHNLGLGPIQAYKNGLTGALALRRHSDNWLSNSGVPTGVLKTNQELDAEASQAYKDKWHELTAQGGVAVLGNGLEFTPLLLNAADIAFIESANLSDLQVARIFGIDAALLNIALQGSNLTYQNRQELISNFIQLTLMAYLLEIEDALSSVLPRGQEVKFNVKDFLRAYEATPNSTEGASNAPTS